MKRNNKIGFYDVNIDYIEYLKQFDPKVPNIVYDSHQKFLCGVIFKINGMKYYVPVSSFNREVQSNYLIQVGGIPVGSLRNVSFFAYDTITLCCTCDMVFS